MHVEYFGSFYFVGRAACVWGVVLPGEPYGFMGAKIKNPSLGVSCMLSPCTLGFFELKSGFVVLCVVRMCDVLRSFYCFVFK